MIRNTFLNMEKNENIIRLFQMLENPDFIHRQGNKRHHKR